MNFKSFSIISSIHRQQPVFWLLLFFTPVAASISCKKFIAVDPPVNLLVQGTVFSSDATANAAVAGIYAQLMGNAGNFAKGGQRGISVLSGLSSDEVQDFSNSAQANQFYKNALLASNSFVQSALWTEPYNVIFSANSILEGLAGSYAVTEKTKRQLEGEVKFIRAFCHFYLTNFFGPVPLIQTTRYQDNALVARNTVPELYASIMTDLTDAIQLMEDSYTLTKGQRIRPIKSAAVALLARVYLYRQDWTNAEQQATAVIASPNYSLLLNLNDVFLANSSEAVWQLMPVLPTYNTTDGNVLILTDVPSVAALSPAVINAFEPGDQRKIDWVSRFTNLTGSWYFPYKYKVKTGSTLKEYAMVLRLAEQYLIRAEARLQQGKLLPAIEDLNAIRLRSKLPVYQGPQVKDSIMKAIAHERQVELFTEWGHRWLDIRRTGAADSVMRAAALVKGTIWDAHSMLYPIPQTEINSNTRLIQNPGY